MLSIHSLQSVLVSIFMRKPIIISEAPSQCCRYSCSGTTSKSSLLQPPLCEQFVKDVRTVCMVVRHLYVLAPRQKLPFSSPECFLSKNSCNPSIQRKLCLSSLLIDQTEKPTPQMVSPSTTQLHQLFPAHLQVKRVLATNLLSTKMGGAYNAKGQLGQGTLGCHSLSSLPFGCFSSPTNNSTNSTLQLHIAIYSHRNRPSLHSKAIQALLIPSSPFKVLCGHIKAPK